MENFDVGGNPIFSDLVEYTNLPVPIVLSRCNYAHIELAAQWYFGNYNADSSLLYYKDPIISNLYLFDLTKYQILVNNMIFDEIKDRNFETFLEYGGGIGQFCINCHKRFPYATIYYYDLDSGISDYARWRFIHNNCTNVIFSSEKDDILNINPNQIFDLVNIMDVVEHVNNPYNLLVLISKHARYILCNYDEVLFNEVYPQHISSFSSAMFFERVVGTRYLWKNKDPDMSQDSPGME